MFHVMGLARDETAQVHDDPLGLFPLADDILVSLLERNQLLLVALPLSLELLGNLLLEEERLEGVVALLLGAGEADAEAGGVVLLLLDERRVAAILPLMGFELELEFLRLLGELLGKRLELVKLYFRGGIRQLAFLGNKKKFGGVF
jgi:hypothetical protein